MKIGSVDLFMFVCDDRIIFRDREGLQCEMTIAGVNSVPNVPFYDYLFEPGAEVNVTGELDLKPRFKKRIIYCLVPDDANFMEKKAIEDYCAMKYQAKSFIVVNQCDLLSTTKDSTIAVSKTSRCISVVCSIRSKNIKNIVYIDKKADIDSVKNAISKAVGDNRFEDIDTFINNSNGNMDEYKELGELIDISTMMDNAHTIMEKFKKIKNPW